MGHLELSTEGAALQLWPEPLHSGDRLTIAFLAPVFIGSAAPRFEIVVFDAHRRRIATVARGALRPAGGVLCAEWDGLDERGRTAGAGRYLVQVSRPGTSFLLERTFFVEN